MRVESRVYEPREFVSVVWSVVVGDAVFLERVRVFFTCHDDCDVLRWDV